MASTIDSRLSLPPVAPREPASAPNTSVPAGSSASTQPAPSTAAARGVDRFERSLSPPALTLGPDDVIAHRGASVHAPEQSRPAFELALALGARFLETDVQLSAPDPKTGKRSLMLVHDAGLERTTDMKKVFPETKGRWRVGHFTREELGKLDTSVGFARTRPEAMRPGFKGTPMLELTDLLAMVKSAGDKAGLFLELKHPEYSPGVAEALVEELKAHGWLSAEGVALKPLVIESFDKKALEHFKKLAPGVHTLLLSNETPLTGVDFPRLIRDAKQCGATFIGPTEFALSAENVRAAKAAGLQVTPWAVFNDGDFLRHSGNDFGVNGYFADRADNESPRSTRELDAALTKLGY